MKFGDKNTKFFHQIIGQKRQINKVVRIKDGDGIWLDEEELFFKRFEDYYKELFMTTIGKGCGNVLEYVPKLVNRDMNRSLMKYIAFESEVWE